MKCLGQKEQKHPWRTNPLLPNERPLRHRCSWVCCSLSPTLNVQYNLKHPMLGLRRQWRNTVKPHLCLALKILWTGGMSMRSHFTSSFGSQSDTCVSHAQACLQNMFSPGDVVTAKRSTLKPAISVLTEKPTNPQMLSSDSCLWCLAFSGSILRPVLLFYICYLLLFCSVY